MNPCDSPCNTRNAHKTFQSIDAATGVKSVNTEHINAVESRNIFGPKRWAKRPAGT